MNRRILALIAQEGGRLVSEVIRNRDILFHAHEPVAGIETPVIDEETPTMPVNAEDAIDQNISAGTACIPCSLSHVTACTGVLNEAVRFAREDITNPEVTRRVNQCFSEILACERIDLAPESTASLPPQEKEIADSVAKELRNIRHGLEWYKTKDDLENLAAETAELQHDTYQKWLRLRLSNMAPEVKQMAEEKLEETLTLDQAKQVAATKAAEEVERQWDSQEKK